jgi:hypothetical protein
MNKESLSEKDFKTLMNHYHTWKLYCNSLKILVEPENSQNKLSHPYKKKDHCQIESPQIKKKVSNNI